MEKKTYSKPILMAERFEPQEFVAACDNSQRITTVSGWTYTTNDNYFRMYIDLNGDGHYQVGERFLRDGTSQNASDQVTIGEVTIGYLTLKKGSPTNHSMSTNQPYASDDLYTWHELRSRHIIVKDHIAYIKNNS